MRGMYTAGVLDAFMDHGVEVDGIVGVSAGACFGCNLFSGQRGRVLRYNTRFMNDLRNVSIRSLITTGDIINRQFAYYEIPTKYDVFDEEAFIASGKEYYAVVTNVATGRAEYKKLDRLLGQIEVIRASASMPFLSRMVELDGQKYLDGGIADSIPVRAAMALGFDRLIVVLTQPADYVKKPMNARLVRAYYHKYPELVNTLVNRHATYNAQSEDVKALEASGDVLVLRPAAKLEIDRLEKNPERLKAVHALGLADANARMEEIKEYLSK